MIIFFFSSRLYIPSLEVLVQVGEPPFGAVRVNARQPQLQCRADYTGPRQPMQQSARLVISLNLRFYVVFIKISNCGQVLIISRGGVIHLDIWGKEGAIALKTKLVGLKYFRTYFHKLVQTRSVQTFKQIIFICKILNLVFHHYLIL